MAKKDRFPRVTACNSFFGVSRLLSQVRWKSPEYQALISRWRLLCRLEIFKIHGAPNRSALAEPWRELYSKCPLGSDEEKIALGLWQQYMPHDPDLVKYRRRVVRKGYNLLARIAPELI